MANRKRWTNLELLTLGDLYRDGLSYNEIACRIGRTSKAVAHALHTYRDVINVEYRAEGAGRVKTSVEPLITADTPMVDMTPKKKPWWAFWRV